jgi:SpoVK/Ycf46/Vps4 family AAA+-type ATPase
MERYEQRILLEYVCRVFENRKFYSLVHDDFVSWLDEYCQAFLAGAHGKLASQLFHGHSKPNRFEFEPSTRRRNTMKLGLQLYPCLCERLQSFNRARPSLLQKNLDLFSRHMDLNETEQAILGLLARYKIHDAVMELFDKVDRSSLDNETIISVLTGQSIDAVRRAMRKNEKLFARVIIANRDFVLRGNLKLEVAEVVLEMLRNGGGNLKEMRNLVLGEPVVPGLEWDDFAHLGDLPNHFERFLRQASSKQLGGVNILFYGPPGTGKTEFCKALAARLGMALYAVGEKDKDGGEPSRQDRLNLLCMAQTFMGKQRKVLLMFDEMDDLFEHSLLAMLFGQKTKSSSKVFLNRLLENNPVPTLWVINNPRLVDDAVLRRMSMAFEMKIPPASSRARLWRRMLDRHNVVLPEEEICLLAGQETVAPAIAEQAVRFAKLTDGTADGIRFVVQGLVGAMQGHQMTPMEVKSPVAYRSELIRADADLDRLVERVTVNGSGSLSMCLYGPPGTGKSAFARYLAQQLGMRVLEQRASDLLDCYVGETEKNIARMFTKARDERSFLILDEADSFLMDRSQSRGSFATVQVNEMLTWMERHPLPFVCTTNLMDALDPASLRRFIFKVRFNYLDTAQNCLAFEHYFDLDAPPALARLSTLTPGDYATVHKKAAALGLLRDGEELVKMLVQEVALKVDTGKSIGFACG